MFQKATDLPVSIYFQLDDIFDEDILSQFPGKYNHEDVVFDEIVHDLVYAQFTKSADRLMPLIRQLKINSITIGIDVVGVETSHAGFYLSSSDNINGNYGFFAGISLIRHYLKKYWYQGYQFSNLVEYIWEHELIHMLDHEHLDYIRYHLNSKDRREFFINYLMRFRNEGIANLYDLAKGFEELSSIPEAAAKMEEEFSRIENLDWENHEKAEEVRESLLDTNIFYDLGPWMILQALCFSKDPEIAEKAMKWKIKIENKNVLSDQETYELILSGTRISHAEFISSLTNSKLRGQCFIDPLRLEELIHKIGSISCQRTIPLDNKEYNKNHSRIIELFDGILELKPAC